MVARAPHFDGSGTVSVEYCSEVVAGHDADNPSGLTSTNLAFDDAWLERDSFAYQHQLATACSVLAAVCNSESQFYGGVEGAKPYAELALGALGFDDVRTDSYALRSGILDEIGALFAGSHDVAAYTLASKTVPGKKGEPPTTILFVGIRGSYGIEWLSNFNFMNPVDADHQGFKAAEREIEEALFDYARERGADPAHTRVLVTGHSRGGAIANLLGRALGQSGRQPPAAGAGAQRLRLHLRRPVRDQDARPTGRLLWQRVQHRQRIRHRAAASAFHLGIRTLWHQRGAARRKQRDVCRHA